MNEWSEPMSTADIYVDPVDPVYYFIWYEITRFQNMAKMISVLEKHRYEMFMEMIIRPQCGPSVN